MDVTATANLLLPDWLSSIPEAPRHLLLYSFFKIGPLPVTPLFLIKVAVFVFLLFTISHFIQKVILSRLFGHLNIPDSATKHHKRIEIHAQRL